MAELQYFTGTMDSGKSTLALQTNHNHAARGRVGRLFTSHDRAGAATLSSRLGLRLDAIEVTEEFDFRAYAGAFTFGPFHIDPIRVVHPVPAFALRVEAVFENAGSYAIIPKSSSATLILRRSMALMTSPSWISIS